MNKVVDLYGLNHREINISTNLISAYISVAEKDFKGIYHDYKKAPSPQTNFVGLVHTFKGSGKIITTKREFLVNKDEAIFVNFHDVMCFESAGEKWEFYTLWFRIGNVNIPMNKVLKVPIFANEREEMNAIINYLNTNEYLNCCKANTLAQNIILSVIAESYEDDSTVYSGDMGKIVAYIQQNINSEILIADLAKICAFSKNHFSNLFKKHYKMTPKNYIQEEKLKRAAFLLVNTSKSISEIAAELSYYSPAYFTSCFRKHYNVSPSEFRHSEHGANKFLNVSVFFVYVLRFAKERACSIDKALEIIKGFGYSAIEVDKDELIEYPNLAERIFEKGLKISAVYGTYDFLNEPISDAFELIDFAVKCKTNVAMILPGRFKNNELSDETINDDCKMREFLDNNERVGLAVESLRKTVEYAKTKGVALTIEDFGSRNSLTSYISQIEWLLEKVDGLKFTFDTGNFHLNGQNTDEALSKFKSKTVHVHCKDYLNSPAVGDAGFSMEKISVAVGKGDCQIGSIIKTFLADNYNGYFVVEYLGQKDAYEILLSSIKIFKE